MFPSPCLGILRELTAMLFISPALCFRSLICQVCPHLRNRKRKGKNWEMAALLQLQNGAKEFMIWISIFSVIAEVKNNRNQYFGLGPIPKLKPKLADTFSWYRNWYKNRISIRYSKITFWRFGFIFKLINVFGHTLPWHLTTIGGPWYFWKGICVSKAHKPVILSGNPTFTKV